MPHTKLPVPSLSESSVAVPTVAPILANPTFVEELRAVDLMRAVVCLWIVFHHLMHPWIVTALNTALGFDFSFYERNCRLGVGSFFIISGYFLAQTFWTREVSTLSVRLLIARRLTRLLFPYWIAYAGAVGLMTFGSKLIGTHGDGLPTLHEFATTLALVYEFFYDYERAGALWSMPTQIQAYMIFAALFWLVRKLFQRQYPHDFRERSRRVMTYALIGLSLLSVGLIAADADPDWRLPLWWSYIGVGSLAYAVARGRTSRWWLLPPTVIGIVLAFWDAETLPFRAVLGMWVMSLFGDSRIQPRMWLLRGLSAIGTRAYSVYLVHGLIVSAIGVITAHLMPEPTFGVALLFIAAGMILSVVAAFVFNALIEMRFAKISQSFTYRS